jgi:mRNA interferase MazF
MYKFGDIVLIAFPFTDGYGVKKRPALVILDTGDHDVLLARITSQHVNTDFDVQVAAWEDAGLLTRSYIRLHKLATIETVLIDRRLGKLSLADLAEVKKKLTDIYENLT